MNKRFGTMNKRRLKAMLILFCITAGGYSLHLIVDAVTTHPKADGVFKVEQANIPKHLNKTGDEVTEPTSYVDEHTYGQIQVFKVYMDSLKTVQSPLYDSIISARPFLLDSVQALEQLYHSQNHK